MRKNPPMAWDLPLVVDPPKTICFQINVPNERFHLAAFYGAMYLLTRWYAWKPDSAHTARLVAKVWMKIFDKLIGGNCTIPAVPGSAGAEGDDNLIRQNPDNPCELQTSIDGVTWCTFADLSKCQPAPAQPGTGSEQPQPGGGCVTYHGTMGAKEPWYIPTVVNDGDTVQIMSAVGAWTGGDFSRWYCGDGERFLAGACIGLQATDSGDPLPTAPHMSQILKVSSTYYDLSAGPVTISGGAVNEQALIYPNDSDLTDNAGTLTFDVKVCNNQAGSWTSVFDFTVNPFTSFLTATAGAWVAGTGWTGTALTDPFTLILEGFPDSCNITTWDEIYDAGGGSGSNNALRLVLASADYTSPISIGTGSNLHFTGSGLITGVTEMAVSINAGSTATNNFALKKWIITGQGAKPSQFP